MEINTCPNECFKASTQITTLLTVVEEYEVFWYLTRLKKELDEVVSAFKTTIELKNKALINKTEQTISDDIDDTEKLRITQEREEAKRSLNEIYREDGNKKSLLDLPELPHNIIWPHIKPEFRSLAVDLFPFFTKPESIK